jgi:hypothetical protein
LVTEEQETLLLTSLENHTKRFVLASQDLASYYAAHSKNNYMTAISSLHAICDHFIADLQEADAMSELSYELLLKRSDVENLQNANLIEFYCNTPHISLKSLFEVTVKELRGWVKKLTTHGKIAASSWPPPLAREHFIDCLYQTSLCWKKVYILSQEIVKRHAEQTSELQNKRQAWKKECLQNEKVKMIFNTWESTLLKDLAFTASSTTLKPTAESINVFVSLVAEESSEGLVLETIAGKVMVKGGLLPKLVDQLTVVPQNDDYIPAFLLTYPSFATSEEVFDLLKKRYSISPPFGLNQQQFETFVEHKVVPIRLK